jgi:peptidoglycan/xylan/chitin deacetylase (PgdA/CDA1 family)
MINTAGKSIRVGESRPAAPSFSGAAPWSLGLGPWSLGCKAAGKWAIGRLGRGLSLLLGSRAGGTVGILTYHRVAPRAGGVPAPTWNVTPDRLQQQLGGLLARGYRPVPLREVLDRGQAGVAVPDGTFAVTFDDGYENVYRHAWPVLRELGVPATVFLSTAYLDSEAPFPFDDWPAAGSPQVDAEYWRPLTTAQCAEMMAGGLIELGSHTHTHRCFRGRPEALEQDVATSLEVLRIRFRVAEATFSFPFGIAEPELAAAARRAGVLCGLTTQQVLVRPGSDPFTWGRFNVAEGDSEATLAVKLDGWFSLARSAWLCLRPLLPARRRPEVPARYPLESKETR